MGREKRAKRIWAIAGGRDGGALFVRGRPVRAVKGDLAQALIEAIEEYTGRALR